MLAGLFRARFHTLARALLCFKIPTCPPKLPGGCYRTNANFLLVSNSHAYSKTGISMTGSTSSCLQAMLNAGLSQKVSSVIILLLVHGFFWIIGTIDRNASPCTKGTLHVVMNQHGEKSHCCRLCFVALSISSFYLTCQSRQSALAPIASTLGCSHDRGRQGRRLLRRKRGQSVDRPWENRAGAPTGRRPHVAAAPPH
jgi:hypothetical protein